MKKILAGIFTCVCIIAHVTGQLTLGTTSDIASSSYGNNHPRIVNDASGNPLVIWVNTGKVMFSRWSGSSFITPVQLNPATIEVAGAGWMGPDIASHGDSVYVVYKQTPEDDINSHIWCMRSFNGGISFSEPVQVENTADSLSRFPTVTTDAAGNPVIGFMKFDPGFTDARWVVSRSNDFGSTFSNDVLASRWSSPTAEVCDCCPGAITGLEDNIIMLYRDNNSNIRDCWAGISSNSGSTFVNGMSLNQQNWYVTSCPASGPDGVVIGDSVYSTFMNAASGMNRVYYNTSSISNPTNSVGTLVTGNITGLSQQNYPRIANSGSAIAIVWRQIISGSIQLPILFTYDIAQGFTSPYELIDQGSIVNADVSLANNTIFVVWQDYGSGTVKYRTATYVSTGISKKSHNNTFTVYPNPSYNSWIVNGKIDEKVITADLYNAQGQLVLSKSVTNTMGSFSIEIDNSSLSSGVYTLQLFGANKLENHKLLKK